jgi:predicted nucleic acid-binding protein
VFIDTNELFPFTIMDVLLTLSEDRLLQWVWTDELLDEWETVIVREHQRTPASARSVTDAVRTYFAAGRIDPAEYRHRITDDISPDPDDRAHIAACLDGRADVLLTRDTKHFRTVGLIEHGVRAMTADDYLCELLERHPAGVTQSFAATAAARRRPPVTPFELADRIAAAGAPRFATGIRRFLDPHRA